MAKALDNDVFFAALYAGHRWHREARARLDQTKPEGWGIAVETYLAAMRLLMNPAVMGRSSLNGEMAQRVVTVELSGRFPGAVLFSRNRPDVTLFSHATGHRQIMDFWLVQVARENGYVLMTRDHGLYRQWPQWTEWLGHE